MCVCVCVYECVCVVCGCVSFLKDSEIMNIQTMRNATSYTLTISWMDLLKQSSWLRMRRMISNM